MIGPLSVPALVHRLQEPLLAKSPFLRSEADTGQMMVWSLVAGVMIAVVCGGLLLYTKMAHKWRTNSQPGLFWSLCKLHELDRGNRQLLKRAVQFHGLAPPSRVFTEPDWLDPAKLGSEFRPQAKALKELRSRLFGDPAPALPQPKTSRGG
jgi:hypothetical protein